MKTYTIGINITIDGKLFNKNNIPYLVFWDKNDDTDINDFLRNNNDFINNILKPIWSDDKYHLAKISYYYYTVDENGNDEYHEYSEDIQKWMPMDLLYNKPELYNALNSYIKKIFVKLFNSVFKVEPANDLNILDMYHQIRNKFDANRVNKDTVVGYVMSELMNIGLTQANAEFIVLDLKNTLD